MGKLVLRVSRDPRRLLEHAADGFLQPPAADVPFPTPGYLLALRQGGLRDDLLSLAAERGVPGWFDPPIALFQELPDLLAQFERRPVGDFERVVLVASALRESAGRAFQPRHVDAYADAVDRWIGELVAEGVDPAAFAAAAGDDARDGFDRARNAELVRTFTRYLALLDDAGLRDGRARLIDCARIVREQPHTVAGRLNGRREIRLVGLADMRGGWPHLLRALRDCESLDRISIYAAEPTTPAAELADEVIDLDEVPHFTAHIFDDATGDGARVARPAASLISAPDLPREVEEVAARVRRLVDGGVAPHRIAVVSRSARPYAEHVIRALGRVGVPASARVRHALTEVPALRALLALFNVASQGWDRAGLVELAETPYFRARLDAGVLNHIGYQRRLCGLLQWRSAIVRLLEDARAREKRLEENPDEEEALRNPLPASSRVERALSGFDEFVARAGSFGQSRTIGEWLDWLNAFLEADPWRLERTMYSPPASRLDAVRLDTTAWRALRDIVTEWGRAQARWGDDAPLDVSAFEARLRSTLSGDAALFTPARRGVQVLEGLAAAFRSFDHVFIVGLDSGSVPMRLPRSPLVDEYERADLRRAGLPIDTRQQWEEREQALFLNMLATARTSLTLSFARYDSGGAEQLPSAFIEEVQRAFALDVDEIPGSRAFTPGMPLVADITELEHATSAALAERARAADQPSVYNGHIEDPAMLQWLAGQLGEEKVWSPTQLEAYAKCPFAYFSARLLRLDRFEDPDLDIDAMTRGSILHDALHRFYDAARHHTGGPVHLRPADVSWARPLAETAMAEAIAHARGRVWVGHPALEEQKIVELTRLLLEYIEWEAEENQRIDSPRTKANKWVRTAVAEHEVPFEGIELDVDGTRIRFRGFIDRVEVGNDARGGADHLVAAVDYKSSTYSTPAAGKKAGWEDGVVLQVPLYAYALTRIRPGCDVARVEYRSIKGQERVHEMPLYRYADGRLIKDTDQAEKYEQALRDAARHVAEARSGVFNPLPPPSCNCPPFCHAFDICRIPGGPRRAW